MKTVKQLTDEIRAQMYPSGEPENLKISPVAGVRSAHDGHFQEAFSEVAKWCRCEQSEVVNVIEFCNTSFRCGMTIVPAPRGHIRRVFTVVGDDFCDPVEYRPVGWPQPECLGRKVLANVGTLPTVPDLPLGFSKADAATDCVSGRARAGVWSIWQGNIYLFPWIQSTEKVVIEWDGIKSEWGDLDIVNPDQDYRQCVKLWAQFAHERDFGEQGEASKFKGLFDVQLGDLIWECAQRNKLPANPQMCLPEPCARLLCGQFEQTGIATAASLVLGHIGNFSADANGGAVALLVKSFAPSAILASSVPGSSDFDALVGANYHDYLFPYAGIHGAGAAKNEFWPCPNEGTYEGVLGIAGYTDFFTLPDPELHYDVCLGLVHVFSVDTWNDGNGLVEGDAQAEWLKAKLMLSPARWKIVQMGNTNWLGGDPSLPLKDWGADLVVCGGGNANGRYQRVTIGGLVGILNGLGGGSNAGSDPGAPEDFFKNGIYGAGKITVDAASLKYEFFDVNGVLIDSVTLTK